MKGLITGPGLVAPVDVDFPDHPESSAEALVNASMKVAQAKGLERVQFTHGELRILAAALRRFREEVAHKQRMVDILSGRG